MLPEDLPFRVICVNSEDEVLVRAANLTIGRAAFETARQLFPKDTIQYRDGARIIARSDKGKLETPKIKPQFGTVDLSFSGVGHD